MMRKTYFLNLFVMMLIAAIMSSCGMGKMVKRYNEVKITATPDVLESTGGKVPVNIKGEFPAKYFNKKAVMVLQPVITYQGGTKELKPIVLKGEKVKGDGTTINYKTGGSFNYTDIFDFKEEMKAANLEVGPVGFLAKSKDQISATMKKNEALAKVKSVPFENRKVGDGVINSGSRIMHDEDLVNANKQTVTSLIKGTDREFYEKETPVSKEGTIYFLVDKFDLNPNYKLNKDKTAKGILDSLKSFIKRGWTIKSIDVNAWASPEGEESHNQGLSDNRAKSGNTYLEDFFKNLYKEKAKAEKRKVKDMPPAPVYNYNLVANGEDWKGFIKAVQASDIKDKNSITNVVNSERDPKLREDAIRKMTVIYREIEENILPPLRRAEIKVTSLLPKKTDTQISSLSTTKPDSLDMLELLYAAGLTNDLNTKSNIYTSMTRLYPADWKGFNNLAYVNMAQGNLSDSKDLLNKANTLSPNNPIILNNMGALAAKNGDYASAKSYYKSAQDLGVDVNYNKGVLAIPEGDYKTAASLMSGKKCNYNIALCEMLSGNLTAAQSTLECAPDSPDKFYLMAVIGARTKNQAMLFTNLKKAVAEKPALKAQARDDREFVKYFDTQDFKDIVK